MLKTFQRLRLYLLLLLKRIHIWCKLSQDLVGLLVELHLSGDELRQISERFRRIQDLFER